MCPPSGVISQKYEDWFSSFYHWGLMHVKWNLYMFQNIAMNLLVAPYMPTHSHHISRKNAVRQYSQQEVWMDILGILQVRSFKLIFEFLILPWHLNKIMFTIFFINCKLLVYLDMTLAKWYFEIMNTQQNVGYTLNQPS